MAFAATSSSGYCRPSSFSDDPLIHCCSARISVRRITASPIRTIKSLVSSSTWRCNSAAASTSSSSLRRIQCVSTASAGNPIENKSGGEAVRLVGGGGLDDGSGGNGGFHGGGGGDEGGDDWEEELGPIMKFEDVIRETEARGVKLPADMLEAARTTGIRQEFLRRYLELQDAGWPLGFLMNHCSMLRNRMLADPSFLFKVATEVVIDSCCATFAEVQKRGKDFWSEFELYAADLLVGIAVDVALVGILAPRARIGKPSVYKADLFGSIRQACAALPSSVFEAERPGCRFSMKQRVATYFYKGVLYGSGCGLLGQGIANMTMNAKRSMKKSEEGIPIPPLVESGFLCSVFLDVSSNTQHQMINGLERVVNGGFSCGVVAQGIANTITNPKMSVKKSEEDIPSPPLVESAVLLGVFLGVSSNTRYQIINGLERVVEASPLARQFPPLSKAFTVGVRFANNIFGGVPFVNWAKRSGAQ